MGKNFILRMDGQWVVDSLGRIVKFTEEGAHRKAKRSKPQAYTVHAMPSKKADSRG